MTAAHPIFDHPHVMRFDVSRRLWVCDDCPYEHERTCPRKRSGFSREQLERGDYEYDRRNEDGRTKPIFD